MDLNNRILKLIELGIFFDKNNIIWDELKQKAEIMNGWFSNIFIEKAWTQIKSNWLTENNIRNFLKNYQIKEVNNEPKTIGLVLAGNIPFVGFHDVMMVFLSGNIAKIKISSKDDVLMRFVINFLDESRSILSIEERLKNCDAYIATGSNNSSRYFEFYFKNYPHILRKNRTSVAILNGHETAEELELLADDIYLFFGLGCRNITQIWVPKNYDFIPLIQTGKKYNWMKDHSKYKNNYDYQLSLLILNNKYYMSNEYLLLNENKHPYSAISTINYMFYDDKEKAINEILENGEAIQSLIGENYLVFGASQNPALNQFADKIDSFEFLLNLKNY